MGFSSPGLRAAWLAAVLLCAQALACPAANARRFHTVLQDDAASLFAPQRLPQFVHTLKWLGVDELRISAEWKLEAPAPGSRHAPMNFDATDPRSYDASAGTRLLDSAVRAAAGQGIGVILDPAFSAPLWATSNTRPTTVAPGDPWFNRDIDVHQLAAWETMLARRYSGSYTPARELTALPRVQTFTLWNEPNQAGFLEPQWRGGRAVSADWYRHLVTLAYPAIKRASPRARVLIGNASSVGSDQQAGGGGVPPLRFIRRLACVDRRLAPIATGPCASFRTLPGDGWSQHAYERQAPPWIPSPPSQRGAAQIGDLGRLQALLNRLVAMHRLSPSVANLWLTEQGYGSNGQLRDQPWTETQQARLNADAEFVAWRDGRTRSFSQFLLRDSLTTQTVALRRRTGNPGAWIGGTWSTGLERENGAPKPALAMFRSPVAARFDRFTPASSWLAFNPAGTPSELIDVWGRARPITTPTPVIVQVSDDGSGRDWRSAAETVTDPGGIFDVRVSAGALAPVHVRFRWLDRNGEWETSPTNVAVVMASARQLHR